MTEHQMTVGLFEAIDAAGGRVWHIKDSRNVPETTDLPDIIAVLPGRVLMLELKSQKRRRTFGQERVHDLMQTVTSITAGTVRPVPKDGELSYDDVINLIRTESGFDPL